MCVAISTCYHCVYEYNVFVAESVMASGTLNYYLGKSPFCLFVQHRDVMQDSAIFILNIHWDHLENRMQLRNTELTPQSDNCQRVRISCEHVFWPTRPAVIGDLLRIMTHKIGPADEMLTKKSSPGLRRRQEGGCADEQRASIVSPPKSSTKSHFSPKFPDFLKITGQTSEAADSPFAPLKQNITFKMTFRRIPSW